MSQCALALTMDFYVYDGFSATLDAFRKIALIFADKDYIVLFSIFAILGIFVGGSLFYGKAVIGSFDGNSRLSLNWLVVPILGTLVFKGLVIPKGTMHIYDTRTNQYEAVQHVPNLIILAASLINKVERAVVNVLDKNAASPYSKNAGGLSFKLLYEATQSTSGKIDYYLHKSIKKFFADCYPLALVNPDKDFNLEKLRSRTIDLMGEMEHLKNQAFYTQYFDRQHKTGELMTCEAAWTDKLKPKLVSGESTSEFLEHICKKNNFSLNNEIGIQTCKSSIDRAISSAYGTSVPSDAFIRNSIIASSVAGAIQDANPDIGVRSLTNRAMINEGIGVAQAAENWLPAIRAVMTAVILGLLPILLLFMVTPLFPQVLNLTFSLFAWLALWGIVDAFLYQMTLDQMVHAFSGSSIHHMGLLAFWEAPESAMKALAIMGQARSLGITIATFIAAILFKFNAYSLSSIANRWSHQVDQEGKKAAELTQSPQHTAEMVESLARANATFGSASQVGFGGMSRAATYHKGADIGAALTATSMTTGSAFSSGMVTGKIQGGTQAGHARATIEAGEDLSQVAFETARIDTGTRIAHARGSEQAAHELGLGGAADMSQATTAISQKHSYVQNASSQAMVDKIKADNPHWTDEEAWHALGTYLAVDKIAEISASKANIGEYVKQKTDIQAMNMARNNAGVRVLDNLAHTMGMSPTEAAIAQQGAHLSVGLTGEQARHIERRGDISAIQAQTLTDGGLLDLTTDHQGNVVSSTASVNQNANSDRSLNWNNSATINDQNIILRGTNTGNHSSGMTALTNPSDVELILSKPDGRRDLALEASEKLTSMYNIQDSHISNMGWGLSAGLSVGGSSNQTQYYGAVYGVYQNMIDALYKEANHRGYGAGLKEQWISNEFAQLNTNIYDKLSEVAVDRAGQKNINFAIAEHFQSRGLKTAASAINTDWMSYEYGSKINKELLQN